MSKHLTGSKRLAVIQRWINGHDDPEWEVLPTKTEGKYIVKQRKTPIPEKTQESDDFEETQEVEETEETPEIEETQETQESDDFEEIEEKPRKVKKSPRIRKTQETQPFVDSTISLEILNQLKLLGEEMKTQRKRKEQKRLIKEVVDKRIRKAPKKRYIPEEEEEEIYEEPQQFSHPSPKLYYKKNHIFDDMI